MTPKEKAIELVNRYKKASFNCTDCDMPYCDVPCTRLSIDEAKECALITLDEILEMDLPIYEEDVAAFYDYWEKVKEEIEKL